MRSENNNAVRYLVTINISQDYFSSQLREAERRGWFLSSGPAASLMGRNKQAGLETWSSSSPRVWIEPTTWRRSFWRLIIFIRLLLTYSQLSSFRRRSVPTLQTWSSRLETWDLSWRVVSTSSLTSRTEWRWWRGPATRCALGHSTSLAMWTVIRRTLHTRRVTVRKEVPWWEDLNTTGEDSSTDQLLSLRKRILETIHCCPSETAEHGKTEEKIIWIYKFDVMWFTTSKWWRFCLISIPDDHSFQRHKLST